jgi:hypothetical protein
MPGVALAITGEARTAATIDAQRRELQALAKSRGYLISAEFVDAVVIRIEH